MSNLEEVCTSESIFQRHLLPYLTAKELGCLEGTSKTLRQQEDAWKILNLRDFESTKQAPVFNGESFDHLVTHPTYKAAYLHWTIWKRWTHGAAKASDMLLAMDLWRRFKEWCERNSLTYVLRSLRRTPPETVFAEMARRRFPSSLVAFVSVHGGQASGSGDWLSAIFGCYTCYNDIYAMRMVDMEDVVRQELNSILVGYSPGQGFSGEARYLVLTPSKHDPEGSLTVSFDTHQMLAVSHRVVGRGGILSYFAAYVERLEAGMYPVKNVYPSSQYDALCISLFPDTGETCSCAVTRGVQVRASARWFPSKESVGLNFGYSIRIQLVEADDSLEGNCQLVGRHWEFTDGDGRVRHVDGAAVIGLQPLFFRGADGKSGYVDLGPAGEGERFPDCVFSYQSQSGPVAATTAEDTGLASVRGSFSFVPGSIEEPQGEIFRVVVAPFPLKVSLPFY